jgi:hypothetical protein
MTLLAPWRRFGGRGMFGVLAVAAALVAVAVAPSAAPSVAPSAATLAIGAALLFRGLIADA